MLKTDVGNLIRGQDEPFELGQARIPLFVRRPRDAFRVLKRGGRLAISDIVATAPLPEEIRSSLELHVGCMAGAATIDDLRSMLTDVGFAEIRITPKEESRALVGEWLPNSKLEDYVVSATIEAVRP